MTLQDRRQGATAAFVSLVDALKDDLSEAVTLAIHHVGLHAESPSEEMSARLDRIEKALKILLDRGVVKAWYTTEDFARIVGRAEFTVREWCRLGRLNAKKRRYGRGPHASWVISHHELLRYQREGLLPSGTANRPGPR